MNQDLYDHAEAIGGETCSLWVNPHADPAAVARDLHRIADELERGDWNRLDGTLFPPDLVPPDPPD
jgi:hypothetical protein